MKVALRETGPADHVGSHLTAPQPHPKIGIGVTLIGWTDRYAGTIIDISGGVITVQEDIATRTDANGPSEDQTYKYAPDPNGMQHFYQLKDSKWEPVEWNDLRGVWVSKQSGYPIQIGQRDQFYDYSY